QEARAALGTRLVERWRRCVARVYARRHRSIRDAVPRRRQLERQRRAARRRVHHLEAAPRVSVEGPGLSDGEIAARCGVLSTARTTKAATNMIGRAFTSAI